MLHPTWFSYGMRRHVDLCRWFSTDEALAKMPQYFTRSNDDVRLLTVEVFDTLHTERPYVWGCLVAITNDVDASTRWQNYANDQFEDFVLGVVKRVRERFLKYSEDGNLVLTREHVEARTRKRPFTETRRRFIQLND